MDQALYDLVWQRANFACEYCRVPQDCDQLTFEVDHIISRKAGGRTVSQNLALACFACNNHKGPNIAGIDPQGDPDVAIQLYHPRKDTWHDHFEWEGAVLRGRTPKGRATISVLAINLPYRVEFRRMLIAERTFSG